jgi:hypothetical protein
MRKMVSHAQHLLQTEKLYLDKLDLQEKVFRNQRHLSQEAA